MLLLGSTMERFILNGKPENLIAVGMPGELSGGGSVGVIYIPQIKKQFLYRAKPDPDLEIKPATIKGQRPETVPVRDWSYVVLDDPTLHSAIDLWSTPRFRGNVLDIAFSPVRADGKLLMLILIDRTPGGSGRSLVGFELTTFEK